MISKLEKYKKQKKLYFIAAPLITFLATMKYLGIFELGAFPVIVELGMAAYCLLAGIYMMIQIKTIESSPQ